MSETVFEFRREPRFRREPFDKILPSGQEYLVKGMLPAHGFGILAGPSGSFKSFLALDWCLALACGDEILGRRSKACGVIYVAAEAPNGVRKRVLAWRLRHKDKVELPFELIAQAPDLRSEKHVSELAAELHLAADEMAKRHRRLGLVVIDTLAASMPGSDENSGVDMSAILANVSGLAAELGVFVLIISHTGKNEARGVRGWSGQFAGADCVVMLTREKGTVLSVGEVEKLKDGEAGQRFALTLEQVMLDEDDDGDPTSSATVVYQDAPDRGCKARKRRSLTPSETVVLNAVTFVTDHGKTHPIPAAVQGVKRGAQAVTKDDVRARARESGLATAGEKLNTVNQRFGRALEGLAAAGKVRIEGESMWLL